MQNVANQCAVEILKETQKALKQQPVTGAITETVTHHGMFL
jgi:hypothetical protein